MRLLMLVGLLAVGSAQAQEAFQGIQWGATEQQIRAKFGDRVSERHCDDAWRQVDEISKVKLCGAPIIKNYMVAGYPFEVSFSLGKASRRLESVSLALEEDAPEADVLAISKKRYEEIRKLLVEKYGRPAWDRSHNYQTTDHSAAFWTTHDNSIKLVRTAFHSGHYLIEVVYNPLKSAEADKL